MANETIPMLGAAEGGSGGDELDLREVWRALLRRKLIFFATVLLITGCVYTYSKQQTPLFTSKALIQIHGPETNILELDDVVDFQDLARQQWAKRAQALGIIDPEEQDEADS